MSQAHYTIADARRPVGKKVIRPNDSRGGFKGRTSWLAEALGGRWSHRAGGYVVSPAAAAKFETLYAAGFEGWCPLGTSGGKATFRHDGRGLRDLTASQALKLARQPPTR